MKYLFVILLLLLLPVAMYSQDISGKWTGNYGKSFFGTDVNKLEVNIELYNDSLVKGTSHLQYEKDHYEYYVITGVYRKQDSTIYFSESQEIDVNVGMLTSTVMGNYTMKLKALDTALRFEGKWRQNGDGLLAKMATRVWLEKVIKKDSVAQPRLTADVPKEPEQASQKHSAAKKDKRETVIQRQIEIDTIEQDTIRIDIIDNARIDNDVISLYVDDKLVAHKQLISKVPVTFYISLNSSTPLRTIKLVAESYGSMPPCTAHMRVITCQSIHTFDLRSTYQTNAAVEFYLKGTRID